MKLLKKSFYFFIIYFLIFGIILNISFLFIKEKYLNKHTKKIVFNEILNTTYWEYNNKFSEIENILIGDSIGFGVGDEYWEGKKKFSISSKINEDIINLSKEGSGSIQNITRTLKTKNILEKSYLLNKFKKINNVIYFVYEGNDFLEDYLYIKSKKLTKKNHIHQHIKEQSNKTFEIFFKGYFFGYDFLINYLTSQKFLTALNRKLGKNKKTNNSNQLSVIMSNNKQCKFNIIKNLHYEVCYDAQEFAPYYLNDVQKSLSLLALETSLNELKKSFYSSNIYLVYLPSPVTANSDQYLNRVWGWNAYEGTFSVDIEKNKISSNYFKNATKKIAKQENIVFIDMTSDLINLSKKKNVNGLLDTNHYSKHANELIATKIEELIK